jgi:ParB family transcriptional regulator, chromosome partitioning protein
MDLVKSVDPYRCRMWEFHDRLEEQISETTCKQEIRSFREHGQLVPALARPLHGDADFDYELIYGARRLFVARHIKSPIRIEIRNISDREAIIAMDLENRQRADLSAYERGLSYLHLLRTGLLSSQEDIAKTLNVSSSQVSRLLKLARLPAIVVRAFGDPRDICERWAIRLSDILGNTDERPKLIRAARDLAAKPRQPPVAIYRCLLESSTGSRTTDAPRDRRVRSPDGRLLFRIRRHQNVVTILLESVSDVLLRQVEKSLVQVLGQSRAGTDLSTDPLGRMELHPSSNLHRASIITP